jgi:hypothetical protein
MLVLNVRAQGEFNVTLARGQVRNTVGIAMELVGTTTVENV